MLPAKKRTQKAFNKINDILSIEELVSAGGPKGQNGYNIIFITLCRTEKDDEGILAKEEILKLVKSKCRDRLYVFSNTLSLGKSS